MVLELDCTSQDSRCAQNSSIWSAKKCEYVITERVFARQDLRMRGPTRTETRGLTGPVSDESSERAHPACSGMNDLCVREDVREGDAADEEARGEEVAEVERAGGVVGGEVVGAGAAAADPVRQRREREQQGWGGRREGRGQSRSASGSVGTARGRADGPVRRGSQFDQRAQARMMRRNESDSTNDRKMMAVHRASARRVGLFVGGVLTLETCS